tara:strand:+ start:748 stop:954 length:207 start_codon:yes stop_codon:yes gene_type:complete
VKNSFSSLKNKFIPGNALENEKIQETKSTNINVLLNRVKLDKKKESRKKILFTAVTSISVILFGALVF